MSRWTPAEDASILAQLHTHPATEEYDYPTRLTEHNAQHATTRTETTYKARVQKIAKDHQIQLKIPNRWTEEEKTAIIQRIRQHPLNPPWATLATEYNRTEQSIKLIYHEAISPLQQVQECIKTINTEMIRDLMKDMSYKCIMCGREEYTNPYVWKEATHCESCYTKTYHEEVVQRWRQVHEYSITQKKTSCNLCGKNAVFDNTISHRFHYDHIDMFDKGDSVCTIVMTGKELTDAYQEIDKCQLLCISCHRLVTKIEHQCGFIRLKRQMTKEHDETEDEEKKRQVRTAYSDAYNSLMGVVYRLMKEGDESRILYPSP